MYSCNAVSLDLCNNERSFCLNQTER